MRTKLMFIFISLSTSVHAIDFYKRTLVPNVYMSNVIADTDTSYILSGSIGYPFGYSVLSRFRLNGDTIWSKKFEDSLFVEFKELTLNYDKSQIVIEGQLSDSTSKPIGLLMAVDHDGNILWQKSYQESNFSCSFHSISCPFPNQWLISAFVTNQITNERNSVLLVADSTGEVYKSTQALSDGGQYGSINLSPDQNYYLTGLRYGGQELSAFVTKIDTSFSTTHWSYTYTPFSNNPFGNVGYRSVVLDDGSLIFSVVTGYLTFYKILIRIDSTGNPIWVLGGGPNFSVLNGHEIYFHDDFSNSLFKTDTAGTHIRSFTYSNPVTDRPGQMISTNGSLVQVMHNGIFSPDTTSCLVSASFVQSDSAYLWPVIPADTVISFAFSLPSTISGIISSQGITFVDVCVPNAIETINIGSLDIFPNPASNKIQISINSNPDNYHLVEIYNNLGVLLISQNHSHNTDHDFNIDISGLARGMYHAVVKSNSQTMSKRFVKL